MDLRSIYKSPATARRRGSTAIDPEGKRKTKGTAVMVVSRHCGGGGEEREMQRRMGDSGGGKRGGGLRRRRQIEAVVCDK